MVLCLNFTIRGFNMEFGFVAVLFVIAAIVFLISAVKQVPQAGSNAIHVSGELEYA